MDDNGVLLTADELEAIARRLGMRRFPGVGATLYDEVPVTQHPLLTVRLIAGLTARGLVAERNDQLLAEPRLSLLLGPTLRGTTTYRIERGDDRSRGTSELGADGGVVVWHRAEGVYHRFDALRTDGDVAAALMTLLDISAGSLANVRPFRRRRSQLDAAGERPELVPPVFAELADNWRATTTITQCSSAGGAVAYSWLTVVEGGGRLWLIEPDPDSPDDGLLDGDDPLLTVTPQDAAGLSRRLSSWCDSLAAV